mmetsp:Transcript_11584/g.32911  ORF Transcript_11584/g.32911 Transcript_11584/m.32911 type:complete len:279 (+) Transcript_11584:1155-1991(+)
MYLSLPVLDRGTLHTDLCFLLDLDLLGLGSSRTSGDDLARFIQDALEVADGLLQSVADLDLGGPIDLLLGQPNVRLALCGIVGRLGKQLDFTVGFGHVLDVGSKVLDGVLVRIAEVDRAVVLSVHELVQTIDKVRHILEGPSLLAIAVDGNILVLQGLDDEVRDDSTIVGVHSRSERVEDTGDTNLHIVLVAVAVHHGLGDSLAFVVARSRPNGIHIAPIRFWLGMDLRVAINLRCRRQKHACLDPLGETKHIDGSHRARLDGLDGIVLIVGRTCRAS